ncbi:MAG: SIMPL domain-containing protein [Pseudomonadota bacterium]
MRVVPALLVSLWCLAAPTSLLAQNQLSLGELQPGQLVLNLNATEQQEVAQDTLNATLEFSVQGRDQVALQNRVNEALATALTTAKAVDGVNVQSGYYQVYQVENEPGVFSADNPVWRAQQSLQLDSLDSAALLELIGQLQTEGLTVSNFYYSLSPARYEQVSAELTTQVLNTLQQRAENAGKALGKATAALVEVTLGGNANISANEEVFMMARRTVDAKVANPVADPGATPVAVTVSARAILSP